MLTGEVSSAISRFFAASPGFAHRIQSGSGIAFAVMSKLALPSPFPLIGRRLDATAHRMLQPPGSFPVDFSMPKGEPALIAAD